MSLVEAEKILEDYKLESGTTDIGNVYYAAIEFQKALEEERKRVAYYGEEVSKCYDVINRDAELESIGAFQSLYKKMDRYLFALNEIRNKTIVWRKDRGLETLQEVHRIARDAMEHRMTDVAVCPICNDEGWVCEEHNEKPWPHDECAGPGMPCKCDKGYGKPGYKT